MEDPQSEPFFIALSMLRERLQQGATPPGARITAVDLADELGLSTTPVREALSRLAGEDLVEDRRGQGYFVRRLNGADIADLYRVSLALLLIALDPKRPLRGAPAAAAPAPSEPAATSDAAELGDPVEAVEQLFLGWVAATGSRLLMRDFRILQIRVGPVRRVEAQLFGDLRPEAELLVGSVGRPLTERLAILRQFHAARIRDADRLSASLEALAPSRKK